MYTSFGDVDLDYVTDLSIRLMYTGNNASEGSLRNALDISCTWISSRRGVGGSPGIQYFLIRTKWDFFGPLLPGGGSQKDFIIRLILKHKSPKIVLVNAICKWQKVVKVSARHCLGPLALYLHSSNRSGHSSCTYHRRQGHQEARLFTTII